MCLLSGRVAASSLIMPCRTRSARLMGSLDYGRPSHTTISGLRISSMCLLQRSSRGLRGWSFSSLGAKIYVYMTEGEDKGSISGPLSESPLFSRFILTLLTISPYISQLLSLPAQYFTSDGVLEPISLFFLSSLYLLRFVLFSKSLPSRLLSPLARYYCIHHHHHHHHIIGGDARRERERRTWDRKGENTYSYGTTGIPGSRFCLLFKFSSAPFGFFIHLFGCSLWFAVLLRVNKAPPFLASKYPPSGNYLG